MDLNLTANEQKFRDEFRAWLKTNLPQEWKGATNSEDRDDYIEYLRESADPILISEPTPYFEIRKRLRRTSEIRAFDRGAKISTEVFHLFEGSVKRAFDSGVIADSLGPTGMTAAIWSILDGAFMVTRNREFIVRTTGFQPDGFIAKALDSYLQSVAAATRAGRSGRVTGMPRKGTAL